MTKDEALSLALDWFICYQDKSMSRNNAEALTDEIITALKEALAQPEPWEKFCDSNCVWTDHHPDCKLAQRKPLTDEEIEDVWANCSVDWDDTINVLTLARAIEAAHGIKGEHETQMATSPR